MFSILVHNRSPACLSREMGPLLFITCMMTPRCLHNNKNVQLGINDFLKASYVNLLIPYLSSCKSKVMWAEQATASSLGQPQAYLSLGWRKVMCWWSVWGQKGEYSSLLDIHTHLTVLLPDWHVGYKSASMSWSSLTLSLFGSRVILPVAHQCSINLDSNYRPLPFLYIPSYIHYPTFNPSLWVTPSDYLVRFVPEEKVLYSHTPFLAK